LTYWAIGEHAINQRIAESACSGSSEVINNGEEASIAASADNVLFRERSISWQLTAWIFVHQLAAKRRL
jgi:hypothetical protein